MGRWASPDHPPHGLRREARPSPLEASRGSVFDDRANRVAAGGREPAKTVSATPDGVRAIEMPADDDVPTSAGRPAGLFGQLQTHAAEGNGVVLANHAVFFLTQQLIEVDGAQGHTPTWGRPTAA